MPPSGNEPARSIPAGCVYVQCALDRTINNRGPDRRKESSKGARRSRVGAVADGIGSPGSLTRRLRTSYGPFPSRKVTSAIPNSGSPGNRARQSFRMRKDNLTLFEKLCNLERIFDPIGRTGKKIRPSMTFAGASPPERPKLRR